jgi:hypothetical protein
LLAWHRARDASPWYCETARRECATASETLFKWDREPFVARLRDSLICSAAVQAQPLSSLRSRGLAGKLLCKLRDPQVAPTAECSDPKTGLSRHCRPHSNVAAVRRLGVAQVFDSHHGKWHYGIMANSRKGRLAELTCASRPHGACRRSCHKNAGSSSQDRDRSHGSWTSRGTAPMPCHDMVGEHVNRRRATAP